MTTTRIAYRIGADADGDSHFWQVVEIANNYGARIETPTDDDPAVDIYGTPDTLRAIAAALVCIADAQDKESNR
jgi:hypothetical protein